MMFRCRLFGQIYRHFAIRSSSSKVPHKPTWTPVDASKLPPVEEISLDLVNHLERLSLVEFSNEEGLRRLREAINSANQLYIVNTDGVEPLDSVLEDRTLFLRKDEVTEGDCREEILSNASKVEEDFFVAPPGNIPLKQQEKEYKGKLKSSEPEF